jgi:prolipoprotein diacylglyceryltransferase
VKFDLLGLSVTQAQVISTTLILLGLGGILYLKRNPKKLADW